MAKQLLIISHDVVGSHMAGPGIRYWELARALAPHMAVTLVAPRPINLSAAGITTASYTWGEAATLAPHLHSTEAILANGYLLQAHPELAAVAAPLLLDLYDPTLLENLELRRADPAAEREQQTRQDVELLTRQLRAGDGFLCATERQRDLYLGALMATGRITPARAEADPLLRGLIDVVPFGLPAEAPTRGEPALRGVLPLIGAHDPLILWSGGLWDWMDPQGLVLAMPAVLEQHPSARLVFLAGRHPGLGLLPRAGAEARALAQELGLLDRNIFFYEAWVPYTRRADFLLEATLVVSLHRQHLETAYAALRSRFLDHLWVGVASIVSDGDQAAALVRAESLGLVVPPQDSAAIEAALNRLLADEEQRTAQAARARALAPHYAWPQHIGPIVRFVERATPHQRSAPAIGEPSLPMSAPEAPQPTDAAQIERERLLHMTRNSAVQALEQTWRVSERPLPGGRLARLRRLLVDQLVRPFVQPLIEQQQEQNAAVLRAAYAINELNDYQRILLERLSHEISQLYRLNNGQTEALNTAQHENLVRINELEGNLQHAQLQISNIEQGMKDSNERDLRQRHMLSQQISDFAEQLVGLEEAEQQIRALLRGESPPPPASLPQEQTP